MNRKNQAMDRGDQSFRLFVENVPDYAIFMLDRDGRISTWNAGARNIKGYTAEEVVGTDYSRFYTPRDREAGVPRKYLLKAAAEGRVEAEGWRVRKDGTRFWAHVTIVALRGEDGLLQAFGKITRDVTERRRYEQALAKANEQLERRVRERTAELEAISEERDAFNASVSHDLRAPIRNIRSFLDLLRQNLASELSAEAEDCFDRLRQITGSMNQLIDDLLAFSRLGRSELHKTEVDLEALVDSVVAGLNIEGRRVDWVRHPLPQVRADPSLVRQVFVNLLDNAVKYSSPREVAVIEIGCRGREDEFCEIFVRDNGAGFDSACLDRLFRPFQRLHSAREFPGNGMGLAIVRLILHRHGGDIWAASEEGEGATFTLRLPCAWEGVAPVD
jgi:PAS domain S-box-containing protein